MFDLTEYNTYRVASKASNVYFPKSIEQVQEYLKKHPNAIILGNGSNIILTKPNYADQPFIILRENFSQISVEGCQVTANAGVSLQQLSLVALEHELSGVEILYDVPATVGGAIWMNAGAYGASIYDHLTEVTTIHRHSRIIKTYQKSEIEYVYRHTIFQEIPEVIVSIAFEFAKANKVKIKAKMNEILITRRLKLPQEPSGGSVFKRPNYHISVGEMVENLSLKGFQIGGAMISKKHGGVIINHHNATADDIYQLIEKIKRAVWARYQVALELEQVLL